MISAKSGSSKPIDPRRRERNRTLARESRQRKKEYIQSLENQITSLRSTVTELRSELDKHKKKGAHELLANPNSVEARRCIREEVMKHIEQMIKEDQDNKLIKHSQDNDLKECIGYLEANHGPLSENRKAIIRNTIKTLIDKLLPDFVKCVLLRSDEKVEFESENLSKMMKCSKYQYTEIINKKDVTDWEKCMVLMDLNKEQLQKMRELKIFAQNSRK